MQSQGKKQQKPYQQKAIQAFVDIAENNCIPGFAFIVNQKCKNKIYKLWNVDHWNPVLQLPRIRSNKQKETKMWIRKDHVQK